MEARIIVFSGESGEILYNTKIEVNNVEDVLKMVTGGIESAKADEITANDIISDIDKEIITKTIEQETDFCKTVQITKEVKLQVSIDKN